MLRLMIADKYLLVSRLGSLTLPPLHRLVPQLESSGPGAVDASVSMSDGNSFLGGSSAMKGAEAPDVKKFSTRLSQQYKEKINYYRQAIYTLLG